MGREDTRKAKRNINLMDDILTEGYKPESPVIGRQPTEEENLDKLRSALLNSDEPVIKKKQEKIEKQVSKNKLIVIKPPEKIQQNIKLDEDIHTALHSAVTSDDGKKNAGAKGLISIIAQNGIIRELVELGIYDKSFLKNIKPYT